MKEFFFPNPSERTIGKLVRNFLIVFFGGALLMSLFQIIPLPTIIKMVVSFLCGLSIIGFWFWSVIQIFKRFFSKTYKEENSPDQRFQTNLIKTSFIIGILIVISVIVTIVIPICFSA